MNKIAHRTRSKYPLKNQNSFFDFESKLPIELLLGDNLNNLISSGFCFSWELTYLKIWTTMIFTNH